MFKRLISKNCYAYDFCYENKIIEFNGDFWHMNPKLFESNYKNPVSKISAKDKWKYDKEKNNVARSYGYDVLVIWECDYNKNRDDVIKKCIEFLEDK